MNIIVLTPMRLLGDGLIACFRGRAEINIVAIVDDLQSLRDSMSGASVELILIDVTRGVNRLDVRDLVAEYPAVALVALGLGEQSQEVIQCGRAGFSGYVARSATADVLAAALSDVANGRLACPPEISAVLLRALCGSELTPHDERNVLDILTRRECDVLQLLGEGLSNKEIARELCLSVATIKHHVHNILDKLKLARRAEAMSKVRSLPWIAARGIGSDRILANGKR